MESFIQNKYTVRIQKLKVNKRHKNDFSIMIVRCANRMAVLYRVSQIRLAAWRPRNWYKQRRDKSGRNCIIPRIYWAVLTIFGNISKNEKTLFHANFWAPPTDVNKFSITRFNSYQPSTNSNTVKYLFLSQIHQYITLDISRTLRTCSDYLQRFIDRWKFSFLQHCNCQ